MKTLTSVQKEDLKLLLQHRGFQVIVDVIEDFELEVLKSLKTISVGSADQLQILNAKQNYLKGLEDMLNLLKNQTNTIWQREIK